MEQKITPMMQQWFGIKKEHPDKILFFRMGDFYEMFYEDAHKASAILQITLTRRADTPMCGFPYHAYTNYIYKLVSAGEKVAIVEQMEDPKTSEGKLVKRGVTQVVTPGTLTDPDTLDYKNNNYLVSFLYNDESKVLSFVALDISTGDLDYNVLESDFPAIEIESLLVRYRPREIIMREADKKWAEEINLNSTGALVNYLADYIFAQEYAIGKILFQYNIASLDSLGLSGKNMQVGSLNALIQYCRDTQLTELSHIKIPKIFRKTSYMQIDSMTQTNLELVINNHDGKTTHTLLSAIDETVTAMGGRLLKSTILKPFCELSLIEDRLNIVTALVKNPTVVSDFRSYLKRIYDLERLCARLALNKILPKEFITMKNSLKNFSDLIQAVEVAKIPGLQPTNIPDAMELYLIIDGVLLEEPNNLLNEGGVVRKNIDKALEEYHDISLNGQQRLLELTEREKVKCNISNLKIKYNNNAGYYFEITKGQVKNAPEHFIKKQTLTNATRYTTEELIELQDKLLNAKERSIALEKQIYDNLKELLKKRVFDIQKIAEFCASVDLHTSFAYFASNRGYCCPQFSKQNVLDIKGGRHPVIEKDMGINFIPNDLYMDSKEDLIHIITGPNMSGKSTYLRQNALIVLLAHIGSWVPATSAKISLCDRIFTRIGASDNLSKGESTFLVEMNETANILANATEHSLVIMDEIGRGTSTYDGLSLAWSILEYMHNQKKMRSKTLFATHYHELTVLEETLKGVRNYHFTVHESNRRLTFLKKIVAGAADRSYGIHVAELAGLPKEVLGRAWEIEKELEGQKIAKITPSTVISKPSGATSFDQSKTLEILEIIKSYKLETKTPMEAMLFIEELKKRVALY